MVNWDFYPTLSFEDLEKCTWKRFCKKQRNNRRWQWINLQTVVSQPFVCGVQKTAKMLDTESNSIEHKESSNATLSENITSSDCSMDVE